MLARFSVSRKLPRDLGFQTVIVDDYLKLKKSKAKREGMTGLFGN